MSSNAATDGQPPISAIPEERSPPQPPPTITQKALSIPIELATTTATVAGGGLSTFTVLDDFSTASSLSLKSHLKAIASNISNLFFKNEIRSGLRSLMVFSASLIIIASILLSYVGKEIHEHHYNYGGRDPEGALFGENRYGRIFIYGLSFSIIVALPSIVDILFSCFLLRGSTNNSSGQSNSHDFGIYALFKSPREYSRVVVIATIILPNFLLLLKVIPPIVIDLIMFYQYIIIFFTIVYRIMSLSITQQTDIPICELREIFSLSLFTMFLAFCYKLSLHAIIPYNQRIWWKHAFTTILLLVQLITCFKLKNWLKQTTKLSKILGLNRNNNNNGNRKDGNNSNSLKEVFLSGDQKFTFYSLMFCIVMALGFTITHIATYRLEYVYFPKNPDCYIILEWLCCTFIFMWVTLRDFEVRKSEIETSNQLTYNRKMTRSISHEIRTPLNTAFMALELLISNLSSSLSTKSSDQSMMSPTSTAKELSANADYSASSLLEIAESVKEGCDIALTILNQLLTFEKLSAGMLQLENKLLSVEDMLASNMKLFKMQAQQSGITFKLDPGNVNLKNLHVYIDEHKMNQVLRNLLSNAMKFTPKGGLVQVKLQWIPAKERDETIAALTQDSPRTVSSHGSVESTRGNEVVADNQRRTYPSNEGTASTSSTSNGASDGVNNFLSRLFGKPNSDKVKPINLKSSAPHHHILTGTNAYGTILISIVDSGPGVTKEDQKKLFQEYVQINPGELQKGQGTGLGLSISKSIVHLHGGNIGMTSEGKGKGATFFVELPSYRKNRLRPRPRPRPQQHAVPRSPEQSATSSTSPRGISRIVNSTENLLPNGSAGGSLRRTNPPNGLVGTAPNANDSLFSFTTQQRGIASELQDNTMGNNEEDNTFGFDDLERGDGGSGSNGRYSTHMDHYDDDLIPFTLPWFTALINPFHWPDLFRGEARISPYTQALSHSSSEPNVQTQSVHVANTAATTPVARGGGSGESENLTPTPLSKTAIPEVDNAASDDVLDSMEAGKVNNAEIVNDTNMVVEEEGNVDPPPPMMSLGSSSQSIKHVSSQDLNPSNIRMLQPHSHSDSDPNYTSVVSITSNVSAGLGIVPTNNQHNSSLPSLSLPSIQQHQHHHHKKTRQLNILVVDDSVPNRKMLSRLLTREHHLVTEASDGREAVDVVKKILIKKKSLQHLTQSHNPATSAAAQVCNGTTGDDCTAASSTTATGAKVLHPEDIPGLDLILMDYYMPNMTGPEAIAEIRRLGYKGMIVGVSGVMDDDVNHFVQAGANLVLCKPITLAALWKALRGTTFFDDEIKVVEL